MFSWFSGKVGLLFLLVRRILINSKFYLGKGYCYSCQKSLHDPFPPNCGAPPQNSARWIGASNPILNGTAFREFRQALDNIRMTAWTVSELLNARQARKNPQVVISFLTAERLRRFSQMARDLSADLEQAGAIWPAQNVKDLEKALGPLRERLHQVGQPRKRRIGLGA